MNLTPRQHPEKAPTVLEKTFFMSIEFKGGTDAKILKVSQIDNL